jgi:tubulin polyglutamylase TTLL6/13
MYLFNDGLVRICTEEYVKPSKQNLSMMCMHLTNYAVNKKNDKFQVTMKFVPFLLSQQATGTDDEGGTKRSLDWFMNWIRSEYGDAKANFLWKRFGMVINFFLITLMKEYLRFALC